jgi:quercetin dioxygenase-like cupin family protein
MTYVGMSGLVDPFSCPSSGVFPNPSSHRRKDVRMKRTIIALAAVVVFTAGIAVATPSRGFTTKLLGSATFDSLSIQESDPSTALFVRVEQAVGGTSGWHSHPADVFVLVKKGRVAVNEEGHCTPTVSTAGDIFHEEPGHVHKASNVGDGELVLVATFLGVTPGAATLKDEANPCRA